MEKHLLCWIMVLTCATTWGQATGRPWEAGPLTWEDFRGETPYAEKNLSRLHYEINLETVKVTRNDTVFEFLSTTNNMLPDQSWAVERERNSRLLRYNQVYFDIVESHRRQLQADLYQSDKFPSELLSQHRSSLKVELAFYREETGFGRNERMVSEWEGRIEYQLQTQSCQEIPTYTLARFKLGLYMGLGGSFFTRQMAKHFEPGWTIMVASDLQYRRAILYFQVNGGEARIRQTFAPTVDNPEWTAQERVWVSIGEVSLGYALVDTRRHRLVPSLGVGYSSMSLIVNEDTDKPPSLVGTGWALGVHYNFKFTRSVRVEPHPKRGNQGTVIGRGLSTRALLIANGIDAHRGNTLLLTVSYSL